MAQADMLRLRGDLCKATNDFEVKLPSPRRVNNRLGVQLRRISDNSLEIASPALDDNKAFPSMIADWNRSNERRKEEVDRCIMPGDRITAVNDSLDYLEMLSELVYAPNMTLNMQREVPGVLKPRKMSNHRADSPGSPASPARPNQDTANLPKSQFTRAGASALAARRGIPSLPPLPDGGVSGKSLKPSSSEASTREPTPCEVRRSR